MQVALGYEALASGDWDAARRAFEEALDSGSDDPEALYGFGRVYWWLREADKAVVHRERANGRVDAAEQELATALRELTEAGQRSRCVHPATRLAEIRLLQGRLEDADRLLAGFEDEPETVPVAVGIRLARGTRASLVPPAPDPVARKKNENGGIGGVCATAS